MTAAENLSFDIVLDTPLLGDIHTADGSYALGYDAKTGTFAPKYALWRWAIGQAATVLHWTIDTDYIRFPTKLSVPPPRAYKRIVDRRDTSRNSIHESLPKGTVIPCKILIIGELPPGQKSRGTRPTRTELETAIRVVGEQIGISPWGSKFGYGRFTIR